MRKNRTVEEIFKNGKVFERNSIKIYYLPTDDESKIFFSLSKKQFNAVERNYLKRVTREVIRKLSLSCKILIKISDKKVTYNEVLNFFKDFKEFLLNEKHTDTVDKNI